MAIDNCITIAICIIKYIFIYFICEINWEKYWLSNNYYINYSILIIYYIYILLILYHYIVILKHSLIYMNRYRTIMYIVRTIIFSYFKIIQFIILYNLYIS